MECCLQWKPRIQNVQGQRNLRKWSKAFYLSKSVSHFPKGLGRGPVPNFTVTELCDLEVPSSYFLIIGQSWELKESWMPVFKLTGFPCWRRDARSWIETKTPGHLHWCHCKLCCLSHMTWACLATRNLKLLENPLQRALWIMVGTISSLCLRMEILSKLHWLQAAACHASRNVPPLSAKASGLQQTHDWQAVGLWSSG